MPKLTSAVLAHRIERIQEMGFSHEQAAELAIARDSRGFLVDLHALRRTVVVNSCDLDTAFAIFA